MEKNMWKRFTRWVDGISEEFEPEQREKPEKNEKDRKSRGMTEERKIRAFTISYRVVALVVALTVVSVLIYTIFQLPLFGAADNPAVNEVVTRYVEKGLEETGAVNMVAGMILDYRAFDTFGESSVLFLAVTCVMMLLLRDKNNISREEDARDAHEKEIDAQARDVVLKHVASFMVPWILLYGVYIVLNGHISPGGGFSGGAVMGSALILCGVSFGEDFVSRFFTRKTFRTITSAALLCYAASKAYSFFTGANGLPTGIPLGTPGAIFSSGLILVLDICVGMVVACTMYGFYILFTKGDF